MTMTQQHSAAPNLEQARGWVWNRDDERFRRPVGPGRWYHCRETGLVYELGEEIGKGGAAIVFSCRIVIPPSEPGEEYKLDQSSVYAAKVIEMKRTIGGNPEREREKLQREVSIMSNLHHPCIVNLLHVVKTDREVVLIMEMVPGGELFYKITDRGALTEDQTLYVLRQILPALVYVHSKHVVHRDLKPENILISREVADGYYHVKVADFGLAKLLKHGLSELQTFVGTPQYWAPEVVESIATMKPYGAEADLWSLGCLIYVMLAGCYPFDARKMPVEYDGMPKPPPDVQFNWPRFGLVSNAAKDLIRGLLTVDVKKRLTLTQAINHPWIANYREPAGVPPLPPVGPFPSSDFAGKIYIPSISSLGPEPPLSLAAPAGSPASESIRSLQVKDGRTQTRYSSVYSRAVPPEQSCQQPSSSQLRFTIPKKSKFSKSMFHEDTHSMIPPGYFARHYDANTRAIVPLHSRLAYSQFTAANAPSSPPPMPHAQYNAKISPPDAPHFPPHHQTRFPPPREGASSSSRGPPQPSAIPYRSSGIPGAPQRENFARTAEEIFNFEELLYLQVSIVKKFHLAYLALRGSPQGAKRIARCTAEARDVQLGSIAIIKKFEATCSSVLGLLPDLSLAVSEKKVELAISLFEDIRIWMANVKLDVDLHQQRVEVFIGHVIDLVEAIRGVKIATDKKLVASVAILADSMSAPNLHAAPLRYFEDSGERADVESLPERSTEASHEGVHEASSRVESVTSRTSLQPDDLIPESAPAAEIPVTGQTPSAVSSLFTEAAAGSLDTEERMETVESVPRVTLEDDGRLLQPPTHNERFTMWYESLRDAVFEQVETLGAHTMHRMGEEEVCCTDHAAIDVLVDKHPGGELLDDMTNRGQPVGDDMTPARVAHEFLDLLFVSPASWIDLHRRAATLLRLREGEPESSGSGARSATETSSSSSGPLLPVEAGGMREEETAGEREEASSWNGRKWPGGRDERRQRHELNRDIYHQALRTSELLIKALDELRRIDQILRKSTAFWMDLSVVIERLCQMKTHFERLLQYSTDSAAFTERFFERLRNYHEFWSALRQQARTYVEKSQVKLAAMEEFTSALTSMSERIDTAQALFAGEASACALQHARRRGATP